MGDLTAMAVRQEDVLAWLRALQHVYAEIRQELTDLDAAIGDADHGINMDRGFTALTAQLAENAPADIRSILHTAAGVLIRKVGGAAGPLYGTFFLRAAEVCAGKPELAASDVVALFQGGIEGVRQRGKAVPGDKTMLDALLPAMEAMRKSLDDGGAVAQILDQGAAAAEAGMRATIPMQARKGRASYLGARSTGHQDPGATSSYWMVRTAATSWQDK
jgi:dihydroxyacetone kinase-like protein